MCFLVITCAQQHVLHCHCLCFTTCASWSLLVFQYMSSLSLLVLHYISSLSVHVLNYMCTGHADEQRTNHTQLMAHRFLCSLHPCWLMRGPATILLKLSQTPSLKHPSQVMQIEIKSCMLVLAGRCHRLITRLGYVWTAAQDLPESQSLVFQPFT